MNPRTADPALTEFGSRLKECRNRSGWSQEQVGLAIGRTRATISFWEKGQIKPEVDTIINMAIRLEWPLGYLLEAFNPLVKHHMDTGKGPALVNDKIAGQEQ